MTGHPGPFLCALVMTTKRRSAAQGGTTGTTKKQRTTPAPKLPNNILRHIYTKVNKTTQARLRLAAKAVHQLPAPKLTSRMVRGRLIQLFKKLRSISSKQAYAQVPFHLHKYFAWIGRVDHYIGDILQAYPSRPRQAAWFVNRALKESGLAVDDPALKRILNGTATNVTNAERLKVVGPYIWEYVRAINKRLQDERGVIQYALDASLQYHKGGTHKNMNASISRLARNSRESYKQMRQGVWKYGPDPNDNNNLNNNERLRLRRATRRDARIQRRSQRRQERGQPNWRPPINAVNNAINAAINIAPTPPHWSSLQGTGRHRTITNSVRASAAHPAVAAWTR